MVISGLIAFDTLIPPAHAEVVILDKSAVNVPSTKGRKTYSGIDRVVRTTNGAITIGKLDAAKVGLGETWTLGKSRLFGYGVTLTNVEQTERYRCINTLFNYFAFLPPIVFFISLYGFRTNPSRRREAGASSIALTFFTLIFAIYEYYG